MPLAKCIGYYPQVPEAFPKFLTPSPTIPGPEALPCVWLGPLMGYSWVALPQLLFNHILLLHALQGGPAFLLLSMLYITLIIISIKEGKVSRSAPGLCVTTKIVPSTHICPGFIWRFRGFSSPPPLSSNSASWTLQTRQQVLVLSLCQF